MEKHWSSCFFKLCRSVSEAIIRQLPEKMVTRKEQSKNGYKEKKNNTVRISIHLCMLFPSGCLDIYKCDSCFKIKKEGKCYQHMRECRKTCSGCEGKEICLVNTISVFLFSFFSSSRVLIACILLLFSARQMPNPRNALIIYTLTASVKQFKQQNKTAALISLWELVISPFKTTKTLM